VGFAGIVLNVMVPTILPEFVAMAVGGAAGAAVVGIVFLQVLPTVGRHLTLDVACCAIAGTLAGLPWAFVGVNSAHWVLQVPVWNGAVAGALAVIGELRSRSVAPGGFAFRFLGVAGVAGACFLGVFGGSLRTAATPPPRAVVVSPYVEAIRELTIKSVKEAPPRADLGPTAPVESIFLRPMTGVRCYPPLENSFPAETKDIESLPLHVPTRHEYHLQCYAKDDGPNGPPVHVNILQYPNDAWAQYDLRHANGYGRLFDRRSVTRLVKQGRPIFVIRYKTYWASGDKMVFIGGSASPALIDAFVDAYLKRYPNSIDPDFDLPYLPPLS